MARLTLVPLPGHPQRAAGPIVVTAQRGERVIDVASRSGFLIATRCGGIADCRTCRMDVQAGSEDSLSPMDDEEHSALAAVGAPLTWRLSCQALLEGDAVVLVPDPALMEDE